LENNKQKIIMYNNNEDYTMDTSDLSGLVQPRWKRKQQTTREKPSTSNVQDRFIPNRKNDMDISRLKLSKENDQENSSYQNNLENRMFSGQLKEHKILSLTSKAPQAPKGYQNNLRVLYSQNKIGLGEQKEKLSVNRVISNTPERILDAPSLVDDFYLNLLDWSSENILAVALAESVYLWNAEDGSINKLMNTNDTDDFVTSVSWIEDGSYLAVGTNHNEVQIYDVERNKRVRTMTGHTGRVGALSWNSHILSSGSRDGKIINHDVRIQQHIVHEFDGHEQEVCGLKWSPDGAFLASGGNDNILNIWDGARLSSQPKYSFTQHQAAVKALAWCPWQSGLLASGGGTADRCLKFWNMSTGQCINSVDTNSQVCSILWSKHDKELVTSHGFSKNQLTVWKYPTMSKIAELSGHTSRVLHLAQSPDGVTVCSGAGDETLRFWKVFEPQQSKLRKDSLSPMSIRGLSIR
jgi:cell division cycle 20, cofactor of APC complex